VPQQDFRVDLHGLIAALPTPALLIDADLVVRSASTQFFRITGRDAADVVNRPMKSPFRHRPTDSQAYDNAQLLRATVLKVLHTGQPEHLAAFRYDIEDADETGRLDPDEPGRFVERWWTASIVPVTAADGTVPYVLDLVQDVTDAVHERDRSRLLRVREEELRTRAEQLQVDLHDRLADVQRLSKAEAAVGQRLQGLAHVALQLAAAESVEELTRLIVGQGVAAMGCDGGGIAVRDNEAELIRLTSTGTGPEPASYQEIALTEHIPAVVASVIPQPIYLGSRAEGLAWGPLMQRVYQSSGRDAWACLPLQAGSDLLGSLTVSWVHPRSWNQDERGLLAAFAAQCAQALQRIQVRDAERQAMSSSREFSEALQRSLLTPPPQTEQVDVTVRYRTASREAQVGGDWYDAFELAGKQLLLVVGDVTGHDLEATAAMGQIRGVLRGVAHTLDGSPAQVLVSLDAALRDLAIDKVATAVLARVEPGTEPGTQRFRWSNAGHPPPLLIHPDGHCELLQPSPELLLGVEPSTARSDHERLLTPGSTVVMYTDGLIERRDDSLTRGLEWLQRRASMLAGLPLEALCDALLAELPNDAEDDVALLAVRVLSADSIPKPSTGPMPVTTPEMPTEPPTAGLRLAHRAAMVLISDVASVRRARAFIRHHCKVAGVSPDVCDTVVLLTSETVTNAFIHGRSEARLRVLIRLGRVRVEVGDDNARHPQRASRNDDALDGRGLDILDLLATDWGVYDDPAGKVVWFEAREDDAG
jgi:serine phosphatase RsbU (regulator of sigma subunit)/anti-sigma regulatory factor (Ser/Thr protein kinase)